MEEGEQSEGKGENSSSVRPKVLWNDEIRPLVVDEYFDAFAGEVDFWGESEYPYEGPASKRFKLIKTRLGEDSDEGDEVWWELKRKSAPNSLSADLLAAADLLGGTTQSSHVDGHPGGGSQSSDLCLELLDGGIQIEVLLSEHPYTNKVYASQDTRIYGTQCYRVLLELLGFDAPIKRIPGEEVAPGREEVIKMVSNLLEAKSQPK